MLVTEKVKETSVPGGPGAEGDKFADDGTNENLEGYRNSDQVWG